MTEFEIAVVSPSRADTEPLLLAAASAGGFPLLDFNGSYPPSGFKNLLSRLAERAWGRLGVGLGHRVWNLRRSPWNAARQVSI